jgi:hypothetical protein
MNELEIKLLDDSISIEEKHELIAKSIESKKQFKTANLVLQSSMIPFDKKEVAKNFRGTPSIGENEVYVKLVGNVANFLDYDYDVVIEGAYDSSIKKGMVSHLHDHIQKTDARVGLVKQLYTEYVTLKDLGLNQFGETQAFIVESLVMKDMNPSLYAQYKNNIVNQHSIGFRYTNLKYCLNSDAPEYAQYKANFEAYYSRILNKSDMKDRKSFYAVLDMDIVEVSSVLQGANKLTPTLMVSEVTKSKESQENEGKEGEGNEKSVDIENHKQKINRAFY